MKIIRNVKRRLSVQAAIIILLSALHVSAVADNELPTFSVQYGVTYSMAKGDMTLNVTSNDGGGYSIDSKTAAEGVAKLISNKPIKEHAEFEIRDGKVRSLAYQLDDGSDKADEDMKFVYDWDAGTVSMISKAGEETQPLDDTTMDQLVMQAAAILKVINGEESFTLKALNPGGGTQNIIYTRMGEESLKTAIGELETVKYSRKREGSSRENHFWYSVQHGHIPVQLEQVKGDKSVWKASLEKLEQ